MDGGSEVEGLGVLVIELDGLAAVVERQSRLAFEEVVASDVVLSLTLPLGVDCSSVRTRCPLAAARRNAGAEREEGKGQDYMVKLQKRHTL